MDYKEWALIYFKNKDLMKKEIESFSEMDGKIMINKPVPEFVYIIGSNILKIPTEKYKTWLILESSDSKIKEVVLKWRDLVGKNIKLLFIDLKKNKYWAVDPDTHSKISENIEKSLFSLMLNS